MTTQPRTSGFVARFNTCVLVSLFMVGVPLAFLWPEHALTAMTYAGMGIALLVVGAFLNDHLGRRGLFLGLFLATTPTVLLGYWLERSTYEGSPLDPATLEQLRRMRTPMWRMAGGFFLENWQMVTAVTLVAAVSLALLALRNRMRGRSDGPAGKWSSLLSRLDYGPSDAGDLVARFSTCVCVSLVMVGVPLAFLWPEHAITAMSYAGMGFGVLIVGAFRNQHRRWRGLILGLLFATPFVLVGYGLKRSTYEGSPLDPATLEQLRRTRAPMWRVAGGFFLENWQMVTAVMLVAAVSFALLALRNRMRGRSDGLAGKWSSLLSKLDYGP